jgi:hypothetical protein
VQTPRSPWLSVKLDEIPPRAYTRESFLRFDLSTVRGDVQRAVLRLHQRTGGDRYQHLVAAAFGDHPWNAQNLTWLTRPFPRMEVARCIPTGEFRVMEADVTTAVRQAGHRPLTLILHGRVDLGPSGSSAYFSAANPDVEKRPCLLISAPSEPDRPRP